MLSELYSQCCHRIHDNRQPGGVRLNLLVDDFHTAVVRGILAGFARLLTIADRGEMIRSDLQSQSFGLFLI